MMVVGVWKNFEEVEESISFDELTIILQAAAERRMRDQEFQAALAGALPEESETVGTAELKSKGLLAFEVEE
jgi:hypothetical protein